MKRYFCFSFFLSLVLLLSACASTQPLYQTKQATRLSVSQADIIARDVAVALSSYYPPAHNILNMKLKSTVFSTSLEKQLRIEGFALETNPKSTRGIPIGYVVDALSNDMLAVRIVAGDSLRLNRLYTLKEGRLIPLSGYSVLGGLL